MYKNTNIKNKALLFSTRNSFNLSTEISKLCGKNLGEIRFIEFSDGEYEISFQESVRGKHIFLIGSTSPPADNLMELLLMCDSAKRASASTITLVIPYFGWARQDRKDKPRTSVSAKLVANMISAAGANRVMTIDLHTDQIQSFFDLPVDHLYSSGIFIDYIKKLGLDNLIIGSPDIGGAKRVRSYAGYLGTEIVLCYKERKKHNEIDSMNIIGNVKNKNVILIDDIIDTGGTLLNAADLIYDCGANSVRAIATHAIFSGKSHKLIQKSSIKEIAITNTIPIKKFIFSIEKIKILTAAKLLSEVIDLVYRNKSISHKFII